MRRMIVVLSERKVFNAQLLAAPDEGNHPTFSLPETAMFVQGYHRELLQV